MNGSRAVGKLRSKGDAPDVTSVISKMRVPQFTQFGIGVTAFDHVYISVGALTASNVMVAITASVGG